MYCEIIGFCSVEEFNVQISQIFFKIGRCRAVFFAPQGYLWVLERGAERALKTDATVKKVICCFGAGQPAVSGVGKNYYLCVVLKNR
ncbi:hypothetical protein EEL50_07285 [Muribaculaceae bacterium Isolate-105 (HZI)]|nr:hypothetical protein EEL50_07285 [Muribaculaceae bacterium Isolate-105 (HZI)]